MTENTMQQELEAIRNDLKQLQADTARLKDAGLDLTRDMVSNARQKLETETQRLLKRLQDGAENMKHHGQEAIQKIEKQVDEHPLTALLTAAGVGFVLGWLVSRK
jgi:ElaB/YqjD/DUF883 family membrane-anchored ribosome-binding protein